MKRVLIWNKHWLTLGGGEKYAIELSNSLVSMGFEVWISGTMTNPCAEIALRFGNISGKIKFLPQDQEVILDSILEDFDYFINCSFGSSYSPKSNVHSVYVVHFPHTIKKRDNHRSFLVNDFGYKIFGQVREFAYLDSSCWFLGPHSLDVEILSGQVRIGDSKSKGDFAGQGQVLRTSPGLWNRIEVNDDSFSLFRINSASYPKIREFITSRYKPELPFHFAYNELWSNSEFTRKWVEILWKRKSKILYPPIEDAHGGSLTKEPYSIVAVGRFMNPRHGHCKNQHQLISAFKELVKISPKPWKLTLVGGLDARAHSYLAKLKSQAKGLDIEFKVDSTKEDLLEALRSSRFFWHATGIGVSDKKPEKHEHFGISLIEAIKYRCIPLVFGTAGPLETLRDLPECTYLNLDQLVAKQINLSERELSSIEKKLQNIALQHSRDTFDSQLKKLLDYETA